MASHFSLFLFLFLFSLCFCFFLYEKIKKRRKNLLSASRNSGQDMIKIPFLIKICRNQRNKTMEQVDKIPNDCTTFLVRENRFFWSSSSRYILQKNNEMKIKQNSYQSLIMKELRMHPNFDELCRFMKRGASASPRSRQRWRPMVVLFLRIQWLENPIRQNIYNDKRFMKSKLRWDYWI